MARMDEKLPPFFQVNENDQGGVAVVVAFCTIVISSTVSAIRCVVATRQRVGFQLDDLTFYVSSFLGTTSSICIYRAVLAGLGRRIESLTPQKLDSYYKLFYTAQLTAVLSMISAKVSMVLLMKRITQTDNRNWNYVLVLISIWGVFSFFALAFQCQLPAPWVFEPSRCNTHGYLQYPIIAINIVTDVILGTGMLPTIWKLKIPQDTRVTVMTLFGIRLVVSAIAIGELVAVKRSVKTQDQTWVNMARSVWLMLVTHASVITATIPRTHSFWGSLTTGKANTAITDQEYELSGGSQPSELNSGSKSHSPFEFFSKRSKNRAKFSYNLSWADTEDRSNSRYRSNTRALSQASEEPLQLVPKQEADLSTRVYCDDAGSDATARGKSNDDESQSNPRSTKQGVWMEREVVMEVEYLKKA